MYQPKQQMYLIDKDNLEEILRSIIREEIDQLSSKLNRIPKLLTRDEAAIKLDVCPNTVSDWIKAGRLSNRGIGRKILLLESDLDGLKSRSYTHYKRSA